MLQEHQSVVAVSSPIAIVVGTRPEIIKMSPVIKALRRHGIEFSFILTGQHQDYDMSMRFVKELGLPSPTSSFRLSSSTPASQIGEMMGKLEPILEELGSSLLLIQGDTNSMLAAALVGVKLGCRVGHIEAGLRSYDWRMPEEHNRRMVDHVSDLLFAPTELSRRNLENEHAYGRIFVTGNTVIDAVNQCLGIAQRESEIMKHVPSEDFCFTTIHRKENVDSPEILCNFVDALVETEIPVVFPVHPRTNLRLRESGFYKKLSSSSRIHLLAPIGYFDTLLLMKKSKFVLTDSGGLQEEATAPAIKKPVILLRLSTERPEGVDAGFTRVAGVTKEGVLSAIEALLNNPPSLPDTSPFGDGRAAERIVSIIAGKPEQTVQ
jgi:UDP-N-acetylglucosamine 2-epimerase (non-hydrolysing)